MNHQMAEKRHFHSYDPPDVGGAERLRRMERGVLLAENSTKCPLVLTLHSKRTTL